MPKFYEAELDGITSEDLERAACLGAGQGPKADGGRSSILDGLDDHKRYIAKVDRERTASKARAQARAQEIAIDENLDPATRDDFHSWVPERRWNRGNFDYLFYHRKHLVKHYGKALKHHLELVSAKINHVSVEGRDGYFKKLERNVGWLDYIIPIIFSQSKHADRLARCGIWVNAKNSRRCHKSDFCPLCLWNDILKVLVQSFGVKSGAFSRSPCWSFITCGFTTSKGNAKAVGRPLVQDDFHYVRGDDHYDAFPTMIGNDDENPDDFTDGYQDARILAVIVQEALDELYHRVIVDGYRNKIEGAYRIKPNRQPPMPDCPQAGPVYVNIHGHAVANGRETNLQFIAEMLAQLMMEGLQKFRAELLGDYYPDVLVLGIASAEALAACIVYSEKVVAVDAIVKDAMFKTGAQLADGRPNPQYVRGLDESLKELIDEHIPNIFSCFKHDNETFWLRRRKTVGNMQFRDGGTFIGKEPKWHIRVRRKKAKALKKKRDERKRRGAEKSSGKKPARQKRSRRNPRRLRRSLKPRDTESPARPNG